MNAKNTRVEFHLSGSDKNIAYADTCGAIPSKDELINIRSQTYRVINTTWCLDHADHVFDSGLRANIELELLK